MPASPCPGMPSPPRLVVKGRPGARRRGLSEIARLPTGCRRLVRPEKRNRPGLPRRQLDRAGAAAAHDVLRRPRRGPRAEAADWNRQEEQHMPADHATVRYVVASFETYRGAEAAVGQLADRGLPVQHLALVAHRVRVVPIEAARARVGRAVREGAEAGALVGAIVGFGAGIFDRSAPFASTIALGVAACLVCAVLGHRPGGVVGPVRGARGPGSSTSSRTSPGRRSRRRSPAATSPAPRASPPRNSTRPGTWWCSCRRPG